MAHVTRESLPPLDGHEANLADYESACRTFAWKDVEGEFEWARTGKVNMAHEAIDRHARSGRKNKLALIYTDGERTEKYTFEDLMRLSSRFAHALTRMGVKRGDRVFVFLPRRAETYIGILGVLKVGAIPSPLFEAFMADAVRDRMQDAQAVALLTTPALLERVPERELPALQHVVLIGGHADRSGHYRSWDKEMEKSGDQFEPVWLEREDPLILHYTSGSTGKPKGALHVQNAMLGHLQTGRWVLDLKETDTYW
ncbi:MAG TPA: AMP-binding protein, partial [Candidatus Eisenbacteria bacterium]